MVQVNGDRMAVFQGFMSVRVAVWLVTFEVFVMMLMVFVVHVQVLVMQQLVPVQERSAVLPGPESDGCAGRPEGKDRKHGIGDFETQGRAQITCQRIGEEPAAVGERELCGVVGGPIGLL